ncbi:solute carrier family 28 member 3 isoform X1 [Octopus bimaculoides]|uniref:solute carrier family 28 member 3 isoform X1 n=1 Tax=Octopus bimaculoides TaxID=37653 RepID=UPI00071DAC7B|nr:solute carrier family 28 member 3 isoform X1 [Octopus bimaculoides]XP_014781755.1 solute carrier family 28 member 3 isoform X1 [Octopus bimaculoides]XP_014781756.1 solute carrier family 28 member 3 isoform X1 [Octopus bimaculoides]XP_014781757.1 solute carrier family 28 member 3 isoform X1 [Octopus bimaculoides]XP_052830523.1 solute carrier family 28 member 3 isoform X1 [Octopus bimaculoides]|eukprot:XP_014781754.1 PREDICTED: solute carrier family 28 member 3-like isoform X1 [Octopus bimaculoides]
MSIELTNVQSIQSPGKDGINNSTMPILNGNEENNREKVIADGNGQINVGFTEIPDSELNFKRDPKRLGPEDPEPEEQSYYQKAKPYLRTGFYITLVILYVIYFGWAMHFGQGDGASICLLVLTLFAAFVIIFNFLNKRFKLNDQILGNVNEKMQTYTGERIRTYCRWFMIALALAVVIWVIVEVAMKQPNNLVSLAGLAFYVLVFYIFSIERKKVKWHTVFWGLMIQLIMAIIIIRTQAGYNAFEFLGDQVSDFLTHSDEGAKFVFGASFEDHLMAFKIFPTVVFFSSIMSMLYYLGVMQAVVLIIGRAISFCMDTTPAESITAASNIFVGMTESPLLVKPFLNEMTGSELHAVMTGGFATISGSLLGFYANFGAKPQHLLSASVMSAPAALALSKLLYPETEISKASVKDYSKIGKGRCRPQFYTQETETLLTASTFQGDSDGSEKSLLDAASRGASQSIKLVANIGVNLIAFISILSFVNAVLVWMGERVYIEKLTFEKICSYLLYPVAFLMGTARDDCLQVAELIGTKTFLNEMIAYSRLKKYVDNRKIFDNYTMYYNMTDDWTQIGRDIFLNHTTTTLVGGFMTPRSEVISTYALCGFANIGSMGIVLGGLTILAPQKRDIIAQTVVRAMIAGNVACFLTACIAGLMIYE